VFKYTNVAYIKLTQLSNYLAGCGDPVPPANGSFITFTSAAVGSQVLCSCDQGFLPVELINSACASDLNWSTNPAEFSCREPGMKPMDIRSSDQALAMSI